MLLRGLAVSIKKEHKNVIGRFRASKWFIDFLREATWSKENEPIVIRTKYGDCKVFARGRDSYEIFGVWPNGLDVIEAARYLPEIEKAWQAGQEGLLAKLQALYQVKTEEPKTSITTKLLPTKKGTLHLPVKPAPIERVDQLKNHLNNLFGHKQNKKNPQQQAGA